MLHLHLLQTLLAASENVKQRQLGLVVQIVVLEVTQIALHQALEEVARPGGWRQRGELPIAHEAIELTEQRRPGRGADVTCLLAPADADRDSGRGYAEA